MTPPPVHDELRRVLRDCARRPQEAVELDLHRFLESARGVIHVGAHVGQERDIYGTLPVAWIEAAPIVFEVLCEQIADYPNQKAFNYLVADGQRHRFGLASNAGASSSMFDFRGHKELWPEIGFIDSLEVESVTLAEIIRRHELDAYNALVLDVQGSELLVLQSAPLDQFQWILAEAADFEAYAGGCQLSDLDSYLESRGFLRVMTCELMAKPGVGAYFDVLYERETMDTDTGDPGTVYCVATEDQEADCVAPNGLHTTNGHCVEQPLRLNLGSGSIHLVGFVDVDRKYGTEVYPLAYPDECAEEIVASHVLEHFSHRETSRVLQDWIRVLKPGGKICLAVPDFEEVAKLYIGGAAVNVQGYVMGGHNDSDDRHGCIFDREALTELMIDCGLERIGGWDTQPFGCAAGPHTLNLQGFKPSSPITKIKGLRACISTPRFGPLMHPRCWDRAALQLGLEGRSTASCYWAQQISNLMEDAIADPNCEVVLTMDFDTIFCAADILELYRLMVACPEVDALVPFQSKRGCDEMLISFAGQKFGTCKTVIPTADLSRNLLPANTGHFGLTLFRADSLRKFPRPWMVPKPSSQGQWRDGDDHVDADIDFWFRFREAGFKSFLAPKVVVGHLEEVVSWPGHDLKKVYQTPADYESVGIPAEVKR